MKLSFINTYLTVTVLLISVIACNPKEEIVPENPCGNYKQPSADFIFEETDGSRNNNNTDYLWFYNPYNTKDTIVTGSIFQFRSEFRDTNTYKHTWYIGSEVLHNYKVWRDFIDVPHPSKITISHVVKWKPNTLCNPADDGYDSIGFTFKLADYYSDCFAFSRKYRVVYDSIGANNADSIDIEFYMSQLNFPDSLYPEFTYTDSRLGKSAQPRLKGLKTYNGAFKIWQESKLVPLPLDIISNSYMYFNINITGGQMGDVRLDTKEKNITLRYNTQGKYYYLKGRILN